MRYPLKGNKPLADLPKAQHSLVLPAPPKSLRWGQGGAQASGWLGLTL